MEVLETASVEGDGKAPHNPNYYLIINEFKAGEKSSTGGGEASSATAENYFHRILSDTRRWNELFWRWVDI